MKRIARTSSCALAALLLISVSAFAEGTATPRAATGKAFNPDISVNFLGLWRRGTALSNDYTNPDRNGFTLQEAELQFFSDVDTYFRATALFSIAQTDGSRDFAIDPEEVYLETLSLPYVSIRAGKMKLALGKHNLLHTHAFPFIDAPKINSELLGGEGLNEIGVSASVLIPTPWFSEITIQAFNPSNETLFTNSGGIGTPAPSGTLAGVAHLKTLFDLNDDTTLEFGASGMSGKNENFTKSVVFGSDLTLKWRPAEGGKYHALIFSTEYLNGLRKGRTDATSGEDASRLSGIASWLQYQFAERWWIQGRVEYLGMNRSPAVANSRRQSALIAFLPSEFSGFRIQGDRERNLLTQKTDYTATLQYNITIGAHPAHAY